MLCLSKVPAETKWSRTLQLLQDSTWQILRLAKAGPKATKAAPYVCSSVSTGRKRVNAKLGMIIVRYKSTHLLGLCGLVRVVCGICVAVLLASPLLSANLLNKWWWWRLGKQSCIPLPWSVGDPL